MTDLRKTAKVGRTQLVNLNLASLKRRGGSRPDVTAPPGKPGERSASRGFLGGFLLGALVGAVVALLLAPQRSDDIRTLLARSAGDLRAKANDLVHQVRPAAEQADDQRTAESDAAPAIERNFGT